MGEMQSVKEAKNYAHIFSKMRARTKFGHNAPLKHLW